MRRISVSIHSSTSWLSCSDVLPVTEMTGPHETVIRPGCLMKGFLGQQRPELTATGTMGVSFFSASRAPPDL